MTIHLGIYEGPTGKLLIDATARGAKGIKASTNVHGFERLIATIPMTLREAWSLYDYATIPYIRLRANSFTIWEGHLENPELITNEHVEGITIVATGAWNALHDIPYTALWSHSSTADWRPLRRTERSVTNPDSYVFDNNNRLYIGLLKNAVYTNTNRAEYVYRLPDKSARTIQAFTADYTYNLPPNWRIGVILYTNAPGDALWTLITGITIATVSGSGSGTINATIAQNNIVAIGLEIVNVDANAFTNTTENGTYFIRFTNPRVLSDSAPVTAQKIIAHLLSYINSFNPSRVNSTVLFEDGIALPDLDEIVYEDADAARIINELIAKGDSNGNELEAAFWEERILRVHRRNAFARRWSAYATDISVSRPVSSFYNLSYSVYQETDGTLRRSALVQDANSVNRFDIKRIQHTTTRSTSASEADRIANATLAAYRMPRPKASYSINNLYDMYDVKWPKYVLRANDVLLIRGIPSGFGTGVDMLRTVRITRTDYDVDNDVITFEPDLPAATIDNVLSQVLQQ